MTPLVSGNFVQGVWTGYMTISQPATNLVLKADAGFGLIGLANPINVYSLPTLGYATSGNFLLMYWPVSSSNFVYWKLPVPCLLHNGFR